MLAESVVSRQNDSCILSRISGKDLNSTHVLWKTYLACPYQRMLDVLVKKLQLKFGLGFLKDFKV